MAKGKAAAILAVAASLRSMTAVGRHELAHDGFYLCLRRLPEGQMRLVVAHRENDIEYDALHAIIRAAGAPDGAEPCRTVCVLTAQDGSYRRLPAFVVGWREL